jgi:hypothetical protein
LTLFALLLTASMAVQSPRASGVVVGGVVDGVTGAPIRDAIVRIDSDDRPLPVITDADGRFVFEHVGSRVTSLSATKSGYVGGQFGMTHWDQRPQAITAEARLLNVVLRLWKQPAISGRVVDETGEPVPGVDVYAYREVRIAGAMSIDTRNGQAARTDDRGLYHLAQLLPGRYIVALPFSENSAPLSVVAAARRPETSRTPDARALAGALANAGMDSDLPGSPYVTVVDGHLRSYWNNTAVPPAPVDGRIVAYVQQFYPAATLLDAAQPLALEPGEEKSGIDFRLRLDPAARVSGRVLANGRGVANVALRLVSATTGRLTADLPVARTLSDARGEFTFLAVPAGRYDVRVTRWPPGDRFRDSAGVSIDATSWWTSASIVVGATELKAVEVPLARGVVVSGRVETDLTDRSSAQGRLFLTLERADGLGPDAGYAIAVPDASGAFSFTEAPPGRYVLGITGASDSWTATIGGGRDVSTTPIDVTDRPIDDLVVHFSDDRTLLAGTVTAGYGLIDTETSIVVFPVEREQWIEYGRASRRMRRVRTGSDGTWRIGGLPPGRYFVAALALDATGDWMDPIRLAAIAAAATTVELKDDQPVSLPLTRSVVR